MSDEQRFVEPVRVARAYEELAAAIRARILSGELREGDRLPSESALAADARVSRSTVREALRTLQEGGFIERASPRVLVVRGHSDEFAYRELRRALWRRQVTFRHLHEALLVLEPQLTGLAASRRDAGDLSELRGILDAQEASLTRFEEWSRLDERFHLTIAEIGGNPALVVARTPLSQVLLPTLFRFIRSESLTRHAFAYHRRILDEIEAADPDTATAVTRKHVNDFRVAWEKAGLSLDLLVADVEG